MYCVLKTMPAAGAMCVTAWINCPHRPSVPAANAGCLLLVIASDVAMKSHPDLSSRWSILPAAPNGVIAAREASARDTAVVRSGHLRGPVRTGSGGGGD